MNQNFNGVVQKAADVILRVSRLLGEICPAGGRRNPVVASAVVVADGRRALAKSECRAIQTNRGAFQSPATTIVRWLLVDTLRTFTSAPRRALVPDTA